MKLLQKLGILVLLIVLYVLVKVRLMRPLGQEPTIWQMAELVKTTKEITAQINDKWVPYRPQCAIGTVSRIKAAWAVFTGKADALVWPEGQ